MLGLAIDGNFSPGNGWAVDGFKQGGNRIAVFVPRKPIGYEGGTELRFRLRFESKYKKNSSRPRG